MEPTEPTIDNHSWPEKYSSDKRITMEAIATLAALTTNSDIGVVACFGDPDAMVLCGPRMDTMYLQGFGSQFFVSDSPDRLYVVEDLTHYEFTKNLECIATQPYLRGLLGNPLISGNGNICGFFGVAMQTPYAYSREQQQLFRELSRTFVWMMDLWMGQVAHSDPIPAAILRVTQQEASS